MGIEEHMDVVGSCGGHVGRVDHVEGDAIKLTRDSDPHGKGHHHMVPLGEVEGVHNGKVVLTRDAASAKQSLMQQKSA